MTNDLVSDMLTRIRNSSMARHTFVCVRYSKLNLAILKVLEGESYIDNYLIEEENNKNNPYCKIVDITEDENGNIIELSQNQAITQIKEKLNTPQAPILKIRNDNYIQETNTKDVKGKRM